jgi:IS30 family transposase
VTLVERHSRFAMLIKVPSKDTAVVVTALSRRIRKLPATLGRSLTWDRGLEMVRHQDFIGSYVNQAQTIILKCA